MLTYSMRRMLDEWFFVSEIPVRLEAYIAQQRRWAEAQCQSALAEYAWTNCILKPGK